MSVSWNSAQLPLVEGAIAAHPAQSGRCAELARELLPIALKIDPESHVRVIRPVPGGGRFVLPRAGHPGWRYHVTTAVAQHLVDALTGPSGCDADRYLEIHFEYPEALLNERWTMEEP